MARTAVATPDPDEPDAAALYRRLGSDGVAALTARMRADAARLRLLRECPTPADLAARFDETIVRTPAFDLVSQRWAETIGARDGRLTISTPPQQLKTTITRWAILWALFDDPNRRVVFASYGMALARTSGRIIRSLVETFGGPYGLAVDRSHADAADWQLEGHMGGVLACGVGSSLTGRPADLLCCDDLLAGEAEALSSAMRARVEVWWESTARTRMAPGAPAVAIGTRWDASDILSRFIAEGWDRINVPALADGHTLDSLAGVAGARTDNGYLVSTRGTTEEDWDTIRRESGERAWHALMQGNPSPPEGGVFQRAWFVEHRVDVAPELVEVAVGVDPADTGTGDEAGILVAGRDAGGDLYVLADYSGMLSQAQWARRACLAWLEHGAAKITQEHNLGMRSSIPDAWSIMRRQASAILETGSAELAAEKLRAGGDDVAAELEHIAAVEPWAEDVLSRPSSGPRVESVTPRQSKMVRAQSVTGLFEVGRAHLVGRLPALEHEAITWVPGGRGVKSPARIDTLAHLLTRLDASRSPAAVSSPAGARRSPSRAGARPGLPRRGGAR